MGTFTKVSYGDGKYANGSTVSVIRGGAAHSGTVIYGSAWSDPPAVEMDVGDRFSYAPELSLPAEITASGSGMSWLTWDGSTLSGTAPSAGTYSVVLKAVSTVGPEQTATQTVTIIVSDSDGPGDRTWTYGSGEWKAEDAKSGDASSEGDDRMVYILIGAVCVVIVALVAGRFI